MIFKYKCFSIEKRDGKIVIRDEFGDVIAFFYENLSKKEIKKYIDENFKCE